MSLGLLPGMFHEVRFSRVPGFFGHLSSGRPLDFARSSLVLPDLRGPSRRDRTRPSAFSRIPRSVWPADARRTCGRGPWLSIEAPPRAFLITPMGIPSDRCTPGSRRRSRWRKTRGPSPAFETAHPCVDHLLRRDVGPAVSACSLGSMEKRRSSGRFACGDLDVGLLRPCRAGRPCCSGRSSPTRRRRRCRPSRPSHRRWSRPGSMRFRAGLAGREGHLPAALVAGGRGLGLVPRQAAPTTVSPASAQPQTTIGLSRWRTMWLEKMPWSLSGAADRAAVPRVRAAARKNGRRGLVCMEPDTRSGVHRSQESAKKFPGSCM